MYLCTFNKDNSFQKLKDNLPRHIHFIVGRWLPGGKLLRNYEYVVKNSIRGEKKRGSFSINCSSGSRCGMWYDQALGKGGDIIDLGRYVLGEGYSRKEMCDLILKMVTA